MLKVEVNVERLVRLQRKVAEVEKHAFLPVGQLRLKLRAIHEEIDSIILGEPSIEEQHRQSRRAKGMP